MAPLDPIAALHAGTCSDPFALLGPHAGTADGQPALVVRFFHPDAEEVELLTPVAAGPVRMTRNAGTDLFLGVVPGWTGEPLTVELPAARPVEGRPDGRDRRPVPVRARSSATSTSTSAARGRSCAPTTSSARTRCTCGRSRGVHFAVWAPNAERVSVVGDFNGWDGRVHPMRLLAAARRVGDLRARPRRRGETYKFEIRTQARRASLQKADPFALAGSRCRRETASVVWQLDGYAWQRRRVDGANAAAGTLPASGRCRSTKCTSVRGAAPRGRRTARSPTASWPSGSCPTCATWASRTSSCCR